MALQKQEFVENVKRRQFDVEDAESKMSERKAREDMKKNPGLLVRMCPDKVWRGGNLVKTCSQIVARDPLRARTQDVDLESRIGKYNVITNSTPLDQRGGFYCSVCDCNLKDSTTYLDHINGRKHQQALGMTMRPERATLSMVQERLQFHKRKHEEEKVKSDVEARLEAYEQEERETKGSKKDKKNKHKKGKKPKDEEPVVDPAALIASLIAGSDTSTIVADSAVSSTLGAPLVDPPSATLSVPAVAEEVDPAMAAMGFNFSSFGGSRKT